MRDVSEKNMYFFLCKLKKKQLKCNMVLGRGIKQGSKIYFLLLLIKKIK